MKRVLWVLATLALLFAYGWLYANRSPQPEIVEGLQDNGLRYFCIYEVKDED